MDALKHPMLLYPAANLNVLDAAKFYLEREISVIPCWGKKPAGDFGWSEAKTQRVSKQQVLAWAFDGLLRNVGIVLGEVSENLVVIDLDGENAVAQFKLAFPALFETYVVVSGSGRGLHLYFYVDNLPPSVRTKGFELRANGCYVVAPPSSHPDTHKKYEPLTQQAVSQINDLDNVVAWIKSRVVKPELKPRLPSTNDLPDFITDAYQKNAQSFYFNRVLEGEVERVTGAAKGAQNNTLNLAAYCMGGYVRSASDYQRAETALLEAALTIGQPELESRRTIASGLNAGMRKPRPFPKARGNG